jgi:hypothetical protein
MKQEDTIEIIAWQAQVIDERLKDYYQNPTDVVDFNKTLSDIEDTL